MDVESARGEGLRQLAGRGIPDPHLAVPASAREALSVRCEAYRVHRSVQGLIGWESPFALAAQVHEAAPLPVTQLRLALLQEKGRGVEGVLVDLGGSQSDAGDVG